MWQDSQVCSMAVRADKVQAAGDQSTSCLRTPTLCWPSHLSSALSREDCLGPLAAPWIP